MEDPTMAKIENLSNGPRVIHSLPKSGRPVAQYTISAAKIAEDGKTLIKGTGEIPDDVLEELLATDPFTKGLFADDGGLSRVGGGSTTVTVNDETAPKAKSK